MKNREDVRTILNTVFMLLALIGIITYFAFPAHHLIGLVIVSVAMIVKVAEFFIRFMF